ncbi:MAG: DJ-1/PfpI family protein [Pacificimonas sp.]|jgi:cyclohexyl-isocyanide hydratase|nr:DJ-1/PfpI family protein [Pacificimonas sp.]
MTDPLNIGFLLYPNLTQLDMTGPAQVMGRMPGAALHFVWKSMEPVTDDMGLAFMPTTTLADCPQLDIVCVPGGYGCAAVMEDEAALDWLVEQDRETRFTTSVCTGSLVLAAAGLLNGRTAACHWSWRDQLSLFGATPSADRVVEDGKYITGGGVMAGIDFGFRIAEKLFGRDYAESLQLGLEYDPAPLGGGTPETARPEILEATKAAMNARGMGDRLADVERIAAASGRV